MTIRLGYFKGVSYSFDRITGLEELDFVWVFEVQDINKDPKCFCSLLQLTVLDTFMITNT